MTIPRSDEQLDRDLRRFLSWQAEDLAGVPSTTEMTMRVGQRTISGSGLRRAPQLAWVVAIGLLTLTLVGTALLVGAQRSVQPSLPTSYEAVYLRRHSDGTDVSVAVVAVDPAGREREITRVPFRPSAGLPMMGAVSTSGLLLVPRTDDAGLVGYEIIDLKAPNAEPTVVAGVTLEDGEQVQGRPYYDDDRRPSVFWGPDEQVAVPWYVRNVQPWHLAFIDGRTGGGDSVDLPEQQPLLPLWASDGSGPLLGDDGAAVRPPSAVLRPDGTQAAVPGVAPSTYSRHYRADGAVLDSFSTQVTQIGPQDGERTTLVKLDGIDIGDVAWTADGTGQWLVLRSGPDARDLAVERWASGSKETTVATILDGPVDVEVSRPEGHFIGLAPDDSMLVLSLDRVTSTTDGHSVSPVMASRLIAPATGDSLEVQGTFVGWMEVGP